METKNYGVRFYQGVSKNSAGDAKPVWLMLHEIADMVQAGGMAPQQIVGDERHELRDLYSSNGGAVVRGVLAVLRNDAPHIRDAGGAERPIELLEGDSILEKNHFMFYRENQVLVWQVNGRGSHISRFEKYMTMCAAGGTVVFDDILSMSALEKLEHGIVSRLEFRAAKPRNAALIDPANWESGAFDMMSGADATQITVKVSTKRKSAGLSDEIKAVVHRLLDSDATRKVAVKLKNIDEPIDMLAECLKGTITVDMDGLYPQAMSMFGALDLAKRAKQPDLDAYFGSGNASLD